MRRDTHTLLLTPQSSRTGESKAAPGESFVVEFAILVQLDECQALLRALARKPYVTDVRSNCGPTLPARDVASGATTLATLPALALVAALGVAFN